MNATRFKNLRSGTTIWQAYPFPRLFVESLPEKLKTDIVVIGAGITGSMVAEELAGAGFSVAILDRRRPLTGSTAATTALLQYEIDTPVSELARKIGRKDAACAWRRSRLGLESLAAKIQSLGIECGLRRHTSLYLSGNQLDAKALAHESEMRREIGLYCDTLTRNQLFERYGIRRMAALKSYDNLSVNPPWMAAGFLKRAIANNARIYEATVKDVTSSAHAVHVETEDGKKITARHVIYATGYEVPRDADPHHRHRIHSTYAITTKPQKAKLWPEECFIWEASDPYLYMRTTTDGRIICGGEDEEFYDEEARDALLACKTKTLEKKLKKLFPQVDAAAQFAWTGSFGSSTTGLPTIGEIPGRKNCHAIMAFGGNGITYARIAAEMISSLIMGKEDPEADLFSLK